MASNPQSIVSALSDFQRARQKAALEQVLARLSGRSVDLLSYDAVARQLRAAGSADRGLQDIPLDAIAGSVGRTNDFTRDFLPRQDTDQERWARVKTLVNSTGAGLPPIQVYQIGEAYFVIDGHHRVSVAREMGSTHIQGYVTEVRTKVPLSANVTPEELIVKSEYADFLERTRLDQTRPGADLSVSEPGQIQQLEAQITAWQETLARQRSQPVSIDAAAASWYDHTYLPVVQVTREQGLQRNFPGRTEADLFLLITAHQAALAESLGWNITPESGASDLAAQQQAQAGQPVLRAGRRLLEAVVPVGLRTGPATGQWRRERVLARYGDRLFGDILVPVSGEPIGWVALDQALQVARLEGAQLNGLHVVPTEAHKSSDAAEAVREEFRSRCQAAGVAGSLALEVGEVARKIYELAGLNDLVALNLAYPPAPQFLAKLGSGFRTVIHHCPRPVLAVPEAWEMPANTVLAYDGSPKAEEALFVAAYLAEVWKVALVVVTVKEGDTGQAATDAIGHAREYLEMHEVHATFDIRASTSAGAAILAAAAEHESNLIVIGGYGSPPVVEVMLGSAVDQILRESRRPVLICQ